MRVLIVEDDHRLAASVRRGLEGAGIAADVVYDGEEAVIAALTAPYDVILLDVMLPRLDGVEVSRRLRRQRMQAPILMLTARDSIDDRVLGLESGADDYLVKPFALREVVARIKALVRRHVADRTAVLTAGPVSLDTAAHRLMVASQPVEVTPKEYAILEYFMLNQGRLLTRDQIIEHVWNYDFEGGRNLIETYVNRLRGKLTRAGGGDPFVTVRGSGGYRFEYAGRVAGQVQPPGGQEASSAH
jgi:DNA-binding response OmpR family regulator